MTNRSDLPTLMRSKAAAAALGCSDEWLRCLEKKGILHPVRLGRRAVWYNTGEVADLARRGVRRDPSAKETP